MTDPRERTQLGKTGLQATRARHALRVTGNVIAASPSNPNAFEGSLFEECSCGIACD